jgi:hypothetical protein
VALIVPAIYFMTVFFFFPQLTVSEPPLPWSVYLNRSKRLVKTSPWKTLLAVTFFFVLELGVERLGAIATGLVGRESKATWFQEGSLLLVQTFLFMLMSASINVWASYFFLRLKAAANHETGF